MRTLLTTIAAVLLVSGCAGNLSDPSSEDGSDTTQRLSGGQLCLTHNIHVADQPGPTQGLWKGTDTIETAPSLKKDAEFVVVFDQTVSTDEVTAATSLKAGSCTDPGVSAHDVSLQAAWTATGTFKVVTLKHPKEPLVPGCKYTLSIAGDKPVTDLLQCLDKAVAITFRVRGKSEPTILSKEAVAVRYRPKTFDVAALRLPNTIHVSASTTFQRYAEDLGIRPFVDTFPADTSTPHDAHHQLYAQNYFGVPVSGYGYFLSTDANGFVQYATGHVAPRFDLDIHPIVFDAAAVLVAINVVLKTQTFAKLPILTAAEKKLIVVSRTQSPAAPQFRLAWSIQLVDQVSHQFFTTVIDARDSSVIRLPSPGGHSQCAGVDITRYPTSTPDVSGEVAFSPQTTVYGDPDSFVMSQYSNTTSKRDVLRTEGLGNQSLPVLTAQCGTVLNATTLSTVPGVTFDGSAGWTPEVTSTAASYMAIERVMEYLASAQTTDPSSTPAQEPWIGVDGLGTTPINVIVESRDDEHFFPAPSAGAPIQLRFVWSTGTNVGTGAALDTTGHEFAHGIMNSLFPKYTDPELGAIDEAFGDMLGAVVEHTVRRAGAWGDNHNPVNWCQGGDASSNAIDPQTGQVAKCVRDLQRPDLSYQRLSTAPATPGGPPYVPHVIASPDAYNDCNYFQLAFGSNPTTSALDTFVHQNSTVVGHWFYLMIAGAGKGTSGIDCPNNTTGLSCDYEIAGADLSWDEAFAVALQGLRRMGVEGGFQDFANSTVSAADAMFPQGTTHDDKVQRVVDAWAAVGVWEHYWEGMKATTVPVRNAVGVSPWQPIEWLAKPNEPWDVDVSTMSDFSVLYASKTAITDKVVGDNGATYGVLRLALAPNTQYYWRVRPSPSSSTSWDCFPEHLFMTGDLPKVDGIKITANLDSGGLVRPGTISLQWNAVAGATGYKIYLAPANPGSDPKCAGSAVTTVTADPASTSPTATGLVPSIQPNSSYFIDVQAIGPNDPSGTASTSTCSDALSFSTTVMRPPVPGSPVGEAPYPYQSPHRGGSGPLAFSWQAFDGPSSFSLDFYEVNLQGTCTATLGHHEDVPANCPGPVDCLVTFGNDIFPMPPSTGDWPDPYGYCWTVTSVAQNGERSPATAPLPDTERSFVFNLEGPQLVAPGIPRGFAEDPSNGRDMFASFSSRAYEDTSAVEFSWDSVPNAAGYVITVGRWPWLLDNGLSYGNFNLNCLEQCFQPPCVDQCQLGPVETTYPATEVLRANHTTVPADAAGHGRYCWTVWPELDDPKNPGHANPRQPAVDPQFNTFCYSTQAATPTIVPKSPPPNGGDFSTDHIKGTITFPYQPGGVGGHSVDFGKAKGTVTHNDACEPVVAGKTSEWTPGDDFGYGDLYGCEYDFDIVPDPDTDYEIVATASGYDQKKFTAKLPFKTGSCGTEGHSCCAAPNQCTDASTICDESAHKCKHCGAAGEPCCATDPQCTVDRICNPATKICDVCGTAAGQACCTDAASIADLGGSCKRATSNLTCDGTGHCQTCGFPGNLCCASSPVCNTVQGQNVECVSMPFGSSNRVCADCGREGLVCCPRAGEQCFVDGSTCDPATSTCKKTQSTCQKLPAPTGLQPLGGTKFSQAPEPISWNLVPGATGGYVVSSQTFIADCIVDFSGAIQCTSTGMAVGPKISGKPIFTNNTNLDDEFPDLRGSNSQPRWVIWSVVALNACGDPSPPSADSVVIVLF